jgi:hypothetical protein
MGTIQMLQPSCGGSSKQFGLLYAVCYRNDFDRSAINDGIFAEHTKHTHSTDKFLKLADGVH